MPPRALEMLLLLLNALALSLAAVLRQLDVLPDLVCRSAALSCPKLARSVAAGAGLVQPITAKSAGIAISQHPACRVAQTNGFPCTRAGTAAATACADR